MTGFRSVVMGGATALALVFAVTAQARAAEQEFSAWLNDLRAEAAGKGISPSILDATLTDIQPIERIIELDRKQPEFTLSFDDYRARVASKARITKGRQMMAENRALLDAIGKQYGVQPRFIVALWGIETDFGRLTGGFSVVPALATLAYDGRRSAYFREELMNALQILEEGHIAPADMKGSWAGAMGQCQFMPSSFLKFAQDWDGDGKRDIWTTRADVFASAANYLSSEGWDDSRTWGRAVKVPAGLDSALYGLDTKKPLAEWSKLGIRSANGGALPVVDVEASLIQGEKDKGPPFLVYDNFRTIMKWNRSTYFALTVGHLADQLGAR